MPAPTTLAQPLIQRLATTLEAHIFDNRSSLLPDECAAIAADLTQLADPAQPLPVGLGRRLSDQGLALVALLDTLEALLDTADAASTAAAIAQRFGRVVGEFHAAEIQRLSREQQHIHDAVRQAMRQREREAEQLHAMIHELSTPVVPVYDGILIVPLIGAIDSHRAAEITARLLEQISAHRATTVILDITGVPLVDTSIAQHLLQTASAARLLGAEVVLVGVNPTIAQTVVQLGIDLRGIVTQSNLAVGVAHALRRRGLGIGVLAARAA